MLFENLACFYKQTRAAVTRRFEGIDFNCGVQINNTNRMPTMQRNTPKYVIELIFQPVFEALQQMQIWKFNIHTKVLPKSFETKQFREHKREYFTMLYYENRYFIAFRNGAHIPFLVKNLTKSLPYTIYRISPWLTEFGTQPWQAKQTASASVCHIGGPNSVNRGQIL